MESNGKRIKTTKMLKRELIEMMKKNYARTKSL